MWILCFTVVALGLPSPVHYLFVRSYSSRRRLSSLTASNAFASHIQLSTLLYGGVRDGALDLDTITYPSDALFNAMT